MSQAAPSTAPESAPASYSAGEAYRILAITVGSIFLTVMNASMVHVALPSMMEFFQVPVAWAFWVQSAYLVPYAVVLPLFGRAGDLYGHRRVMVVGTLVFLAASAACAVSPNFALLLIGRAVQALGAAALMPNGMAVITAVFPKRQRGQALGIWSAAGSAGVLAGPTVGGLLVYQIGWSGIFWVNLPFGAIFAIALWRGLPAHIARTAQGGFDLIGALTFGAGLAALLAGITEWRFVGLTLLTGSLVAGGLAFLGFFIWWERTQEDPVIALALFRVRAFNFLVATDSLRALAMFSSSLILPLYFQSVLGWSPLVSGLLLIPYSLSMSFMSPLGGSLADRWGTRPVASIGVILLASAMFLYSQLGTEPLYAVIFAGLALAGIAQGLCQAPLTSSVMNVSPSDLYASASGLFNMFRFISGVIGTTGVGLILNAHEEAGVAIGLAPPIARLDGMHLVFLITVVTSLLALGALYRVGPLRRAAEAHAAPAPQPQPAR